MMINGYKIFNPDWTCRGKQYSCPGEFIEDVKPVVCERGMHFCPRIMDCLVYYPLERELYCGDGGILKNKVAIVQADTDDCDMSNSGDPDICGPKYATSRLNIVTELSDKEIIEELTIELSSARILEVKTIMEALYYSSVCPTIRDSLTKNILRIAKKIYMERMETYPVIQQLQ